MNFAFLFALTVIPIFWSGLAYWIWQYSQMWAILFMFACIISELKAILWRVIKIDGRR